MSKKHTLYCKLCIQYGEPRKPAITLWDGNAYCEQHYHDQFMLKATSSIPSVTQHKLNCILDVVQGGSSVTDRKLGELADFVAGMAAAINGRNDD